MPYVPEFENPLNSVQSILQAEINLSVQTGNHEELKLRFMQWMGKEFKDKDGVMRKNSLRIPNGSLDALSKLDPRFEQYKR